ISSPKPWTIAARPPDPGGDFNGLSPGLTTGKTQRAANQADTPNTVQKRLTLRVAVTAAAATPSMTTTGTNPAAATKGTPKIIDAIVLPHRSAAPWMPAVTCSENPV